MQLPSLTVAPESKLDALELVQPGVVYVHGPLTVAIESKLVAPGSRQPASCGTYAQVPASCVAVGW